MKRAKNDYRVYLLDILNAIKRIEVYAQKGQEEYMRNGLLQDGIIRQISIIGEATTRLPSGWKDNFPDVPWKLIKAMRNILIHDYSEVSAERVWTVAAEDIPVLKNTIEAMLKEIS